MPILWKGLLKKVSELSRKNIDTLAVLSFLTDLFNLLKFYDLPDVVQYVSYMCMAIWKERYNSTDIVNKLPVYIN